MVAEVVQIAPLSREQSAWLVDLSLAAVRVLGFDVAYDGDGALMSVDNSGAVLGLTNLARTVAQHNTDRWPDLVHEHFTKLLKQIRDGKPVPPADPANQLIQRLVPRESLPADWTADRVDFLPGLVSVPATINDSTVTMYLNAADLDLTWSAAESFGLANLKTLPVDVEYEEDDGLQIAFVTGTSFAASKALVLDSILRDWLHVDAPQYGVLAALPSREVLMIHVIEDLSVLPALGNLLHRTTRLHATGSGPLSPNVYWVTPEQTWHPALVTSPTGMSLRLSAPFEALARELAEHERNTTGTDSSAGGR